MSEYNILRNELINDPLNIGYAGMSDVEIIASLNTLNRTKTIDTVKAHQIFNAVIPADYNTLTADQKLILQMIVSMGDVYIAAGNTRDALIAMFTGKQTLTNLAALETIPISRLQELGIGSPGFGTLDCIRKSV